MVVIDTLVTLTCFSSKFFMLGFMATYFGLICTLHTLEIKRYRRFLIHEKYEIYRVYELDQQLCKGISSTSRAFRAYLTVVSV